MLSERVEPRRHLGFYSVRRIAPQTRDVVWLTNGLVEKKKNAKRSVRENATSSVVKTVLIIRVTRVARVVAVFFGEIRRTSRRATWRARSPINEFYPAPDG